LWLFTSLGTFTYVILAFLLYFAILLNGTVVYAPVIGDVADNSPASQAGLASGQEIISVDGQATPSRRDVAMALLNRLGETGTIDIVAKYPNDDLVYDSPVRISGQTQAEQ